jgi:hypothetical protein
MFYQKFWHVIKKDFMALIWSFENGTINIVRLNYAIIVLLPKEEEAKNLKNRPIRLINCSYNIFSKTLNNRLVRIADGLLSHNQSAFVKGRYILDSVVAAHKIIHGAIKEREKSLILKVDYEKAYDRVDWEFLEEILSSRGFGSKWIRWMMSLVKGGYVSLRINDENSPYFKTGKGLRQGGPLAPLIFNLVVDIFSRMLSKAANNGYIAGFRCSSYPEGVLSLQYAGDTLIFLSHNIRAACHLKWLMTCFEKISAMRINFHKSNLCES